MMNTKKVILNPELIDKLIENNVDIELALCYIFKKKYFKIIEKASTIETMNKFASIGKIFDDLDLHSLPILLEKKLEEDLSDLSWIKDEYCKMFKDMNPKRGGYIKESEKRLAKFLDEFPDLNTSKDEIIKATKLYLANTDSRFIMCPHYFIIKGSGTDKTYNLFNWIDKLRELNTVSNKPTEKTTLNNILQ